MLRYRAWPSHNTEPGLQLDTWIVQCTGEHVRETSMTEHPHIGYSWLNSFFFVNVGWRQVLSLSLSLSQSIGRIAEVMGHKVMLYPPPPLTLLLPQLFASGGNYSSLTDLSFPFPCFSLSLSLAHFSSLSSHQSLHIFRSQLIFHFCACHPVLKSTQLCWVPQPEVKLLLE